MHLRTSPAFLLFAAAALSAQDLPLDAASGGARSTASVTLWDAVGAVSGAASGTGQVSLVSGLVPTLGGLVAPTTIALSATVHAGQTVTGGLPSTDGDGDALTWTSLSTPSRGTLTITGQGYGFTANSAAGGVEVITLKAVDSQGNATTGTLTVTVLADQQVVRAFLTSLSAPYQVTVGTPVSFAVIGGQAPLQFSCPTGRASVTGVLSGSDVDGDGQVDTGVIGRFEASSVGSGVLSIQDASGAQTTIDFTAVAPPVPRPSAPVPTIPTSPRKETLFGALGGQTPEGVASLVGAFRRADAAEAVGFAWDASTQAFVQLPVEPTGGLTAGSGIFVASRITLPVDLSGTPVQLPYEWSLPTGWNFLAIPLVVDGAGNPVASLDPAADITLREAGGTELTGTARIAAFSGNWWSFDGQNYQAVTELVPGRAYWIRNRSADPARPLVLALTPGVGTRSARFTAEGSRPPVPPSSSADAGAGSSGGCGTGGGIAILLGALALAGRRRRR